MMEAISSSKNSVPTRPHGVTSQKMAFFNLASLYKTFPSQ
jgi:hypothetical protein